MHIHSFVRLQTFLVFFPRIFTFGFSCQISLKRNVKKSPASSGAVPRWRALIECPVCEEKFLLETKKPGGQITCPGCRRPFELATSVPLPAEPKTTTEPKRPNDSPAAPGPKPTETSKTIPPPPPKSLPAARHRASQSAQGFKIQTELVPEERKRVSPLIVGLICLMTVGGVAAGLVYLENQKAAVIQQPENAAPDIESKSAKSESEPIDSAETPGSNENLATITPDPTPVAVAFTQRDLRFFSKKQMSDFFSRIRPHLVALEIEGPFGAREATGTIIDSRGWVVTSYRAIKDAYRIRVTAARKSLTEPRDSKPLQDLVRGIVATDAKNDLVILAVNRRFVVSLADVPIASRNRIVKGEYLVQAGPPTASNPFGLSEVRIESRGNFDGLPNKAKLRAESVELSQPDLTWLTFEGPVPTNAGMPLFRIDGTLAAMTVFRADRTSYGLPVHRLRSLMDSASGKIEPIRAPVVRAPTGQAVTLSNDSPAGQLINDLNQAGQQCVPFQFLPTNAREYALLQNFAKCNSAANEFVNVYDDEPDAVLVQLQQELWEKRLATGVQKIFASSPDRMLQLNQLASEQFRRGQANQIVFWGSPFVGGIQSSMLILKFQDRELFINVPFDPEAKPMLPESNWMVFVKTQSGARPRGVKLPGLETIRTETGVNYYAIGPLDQ